MKNFWSGFEKRAEAEKKASNKGLLIGAGLGAVGSAVAAHKEGRKPLSTLAAGLGGAAQGGMAGHLLTSGRPKI